MSRLPYAWNATAAEIARRYPADELVGAPCTALTRAVDVAAPAELTYRWLCQITLAPYSYDLIDNLGRRSPSELTPGADRLHVGQRLMIFRITGFEPGRSITGHMLRRPARLFGDSAVTYAAESVGVDRSRIVCRLTVTSRGPLARITAWTFATGDLVMMRKQLLTLRDYAERDASRAIRSTNGS